MSRGQVEILQFEDSRSDSALIQSNIEAVSSLKAGFTVVDRLEDGLKLLQQRRFDVALLDLNLPDSQGLSSLDKVREQAPNLPIVVISGVVDDVLALELLSHGAQDCLDKGAGLGGKVANAIRFAIHRRQTEVELGLRVLEVESRKEHLRALREAAKKMELRLSEKRARALLEASLDAVVVVDEQGIVRYANPAAEGMFSRQAKELLAQPFGLPLVTDRATEIDIIRSNGENGVAEMRVVPIGWEGKGAYMASMRDITERKQMEGVLVRAEKLQALGTLAGGIAHDFNNILLAISGNAKFALEELAADHPAYPSVVEIAKAGKRATELTKKILSFGRQQESKLQAMKIQPVVEEALSLLRATLPARVEIRKEFSAGLPPISGDPSQVHQIIVNLATNAADAIGDGAGVLEVSARLIHLSGNGTSLSSKLPSGDYVKLSLKDNGPGMDKKTMGRVFEPFYTTKPQGRGTGMGLAIVHGIMKNHLGEVTVYSEVGKGTVFNLYFPVAREAVADVHAAALPLHGRGEHILYVDDEEPLVLLITRTLKALGYLVTGLTDPLEALRILRDRPRDFDAVVTDLSMPQMSGTDLAREVLQVCPKMPVILTTGYIRPQDQDLARRVGVRELILKPDTVEELGNALHRLLAGTDAGSRTLAAKAGEVRMQNSFAAGAGEYS